MAKKAAVKEPVAAPRQKPSALVDTRVIYCGDNLDQLKKLPRARSGGLMTGTNPPRLTLIT